MLGSAVMPHSSCAAATAARQRFQQQPLLKGAAREGMVLRHALHELCGRHHQAHPVAVQDCQGLCSTGEHLGPVLMGRHAGSHRVAVQCKL